MHVNVNGEERSLLVFLFGDYEFLTKFVGHKGPNVVHPYLWYHINRDELKKPFEERQLKGHAPKIFNLQLQEWESNPNWPKERTPEDMINDLATNRADQQNNGDMGENSCNYYSVFCMWQLTLPYVCRPPAYCATDSTHHAWSECMIF